MSLHRNPLNCPDPTTGTTTQTVQLLLFLQLPVMPHPPDTIDVLVLWGVNPMQQQIKRIGVGTWCPCLSKPSLSSCPCKGRWVGGEEGGCCDVDFTDGQGHPIRFVPMECQSSCATCSLTPWSDKSRYPLCRSYFHLYHSPNQVKHDHSVS